MHDLREISRLFDMRAAFLHASPYGSGHINDTYCAEYQAAGIYIRYIHQRINHHVFPHPEKLMENIERVTQHSLACLLEKNHPEAYRRTLTCIPALDGKSYARDAAGNYWRTYPFIERTRSYDTIDNTTQAYQAAYGFGNFQNLTSSLTGKRLHETIPHFHNTEMRLMHLLDAYAADTHSRAYEVAKEIDFVMQRATETTKIVNLLNSGSIPERITHNDTKLNNILLDEITAEGVCVIDLDTTMPGCSLYDFGDMVRNAVPLLGENSSDLSTMDVRIDIFTALLDGYLDGAQFLNSTEKEHLAFAGKLLTLECGMRFLTDYLQGDRYFKIKSPQQNILRCRNQFALVQALERRMTELEDITMQRVQMRS